MKNVLLTGATSGIGLEITKRLLAEGDKMVFGIGRNIEKVSISDKNLSLTACDLANSKERNALIRSLKASGIRIDILIHCAGVGYYGVHETLSSGQIEELTRVNIEAPMVLTGAFLSDMKKYGGQIIFLSSVTAARLNPHGCAYGATKAALSGFARSVFEEARKYGVRVTVLHPDMTDTDLYRNADFKAAAEGDCALTPAEVADAVMTALSLRLGANLTELTIQPQKHRIEKKEQK